MFKIYPYRDILNKDPKEAKKIKWITIVCGYRCSHSCYCSHRGNCKYRSRWRWHNFSVNFSRFMRLKFHVEFHLPIYFQRHSTDLSGTTMCPYNVPRAYSCWDCIYHAGLDRECLNEERNKLIEAGRYEETEDPSNNRLCKFFEMNDYADKYDRKTGE